MPSVYHRVRHGIRGRADSRVPAITSETAQQQLRWIAWGTALGVGPFAVLYALP
jgi:hypothetical protein